MQLVTAEMMKTVVVLLGLVTAALLSGKGGQLIGKGEREGYM